jgi:succinoglycan biosynthesis transport protein ExoP
MEPASALSLPPRELVRLVWSQRKTWMISTAVCGVLAAAYALVMPRYWEASQALVVRQETAGATGSRPGKFADLYEMRTLQETILEVAKSQEVVVATIETVDRRLLGATAGPPSLEDIDEFRKRLKMLPPDGGEFGKTEVFYFSMKDKRRDRAIELVAELCRQLEIALKDLRRHRASSVFAEIEEQTHVAAAALDGETQRLAEFESQVGSDLGELRMLHSANSGQSDLRMEAVQLEADVRKFRTQVREIEKLISLLRAAQGDPLQLIATPNTLLTSQPALRRLKDGLIDAQLATSRLGGSRSANHPQVRAAIEAEGQIRAELHDELVTALRGAEVDLQLAGERLAATQGRLDDLQKRFARLASLRAEYSNRVAAVEDCRKNLERIRQDLSTARAAEAAAVGGSLVTRLDEPETGPHPAGPGRTVITGAGGVAGLMLGLGLVFLLAGGAPVGEIAAVDVVSSRQADAAPMPVHLASADVETSQVAAIEAMPTPPAKRTAELVNVEPLRTTRRAVATPIPPAVSPAPPRRREVLPTAPGKLPVASGKLATATTSAPFGGMSLQEALQAAARQAT